MSNDENIKKRLNLNLLNEIKTTAPSANHTAEIILCNIDEGPIYDAYIEILSKLKDGGALNNFTIKTIEVTGADSNEPTKPSDLEVADDPVILDNYYQALKHYKEHQDDYVGEKYFVLVINSNDINASQIDSTIRNITVPPIKILVANCQIKEINQNIIINKYGEDDQAYLVADYLFNKRPRELVNFDEIFEVLGGTKYNKIKPTDIDKRSIYDSILAINRYAKKTIGQKIIKNNGQISYQTIV
jgi:hypothetical protein